MAEAKEKARETRGRTREYTEEYTDATKELTRFARESYLVSLQLGLLYWERSLKMISRQVEQWMSMQEGYTALMGVYNPRSGSQRSVDSQIEKIFSFQRDYIDRIRDLSERGMQQMEREIRERA